MAKQKKQEVTLTVSGHHYDKDLARVTIKVSPSLQAIIANQLDLIERLNTHSPQDKIFLENLKLELVQVEEEIAGAFSNYMKKKEEQRIKRELKKSMQGTPPATSSIEDDPSTINMDLPLEEAGNLGSEVVDMEISLDQMAERLSPGLPSEKYEPRSLSERPVEIDVRRVAVGASIKALEKFLGRKLSEEEIVSLEKQVESYLV